MMKEKHVYKTGKLLERKNRAQDIEFWDGLTKKTISSVSRPSSAPVHHLKNSTEN